MLTQLDENPQQRNSCFFLRAFARNCRLFSSPEISRLRRPACFSGSRADRRVRPRAGGGVARNP